LLVVDGSRYQSYQPNGTYKPLDFQKMKQAGAFAYIGRISYGGVYSDPAFRMNFDACSGVLPQSGYMVVVPQQSVASHIQRVLSTLEWRQPDFPFVVDSELDKEQSPGSISKLTGEICNEIVKIDGRLPFIYTRQSWWDPHVSAGSWGKYPLIAARYDARLSGPWSDGRFKFRDWETWAGWQFSADGNMRGRDFGAYSNSIDLSRFKPEYLLPALPPVVVPGVKMVRVSSPSGVYLRNPPGAVTNSEVGYAKFGDVFEVAGEDPTGQHYALKVYGPKASFEDD